MNDVESLTEKFKVFFGKKNLFSVGYFPLSSDSDIVSNKCSNVKKREKEKKPIYLMTKFGGK
jgi:hypothetical protein